MTEYVKKSDVLELLSLPKDLIAEYVCDLKGLWIDDDEAEQTEPQKKMCFNCKHIKKHNGKLADYVCDRKGSIVTNPYDKECDEMWEQTEPSSSEKPNNCEHITEDGVTCAKYPACDDCLDNPLNKLKGSERLVKGSEQTNSTISKMEQVDEPITQTKTQNSNLTFEKRTMRDCYNCKRYETEGECIECHYEPKTEPTISKMEQVETMSCQECKHFHENAVMYLDQCDFCFKDCKYEPKDLEQFRVGLEYHTDTTHFGKVKGESITTNKIEDEPQTERSSE